MTEYIRSCSGKSDKTIVQAVFDRAANGDANEEVWTGVVNMVEENMEEQVLVNTAHEKNSLTASDIKRSQREEHWISRVVELVEDHIPITDEIRKELDHKTRALMDEHKNLFIANDILYRRTKEGRQLVLPMKLRPLVYKELHVEMGHLGVERTYQLARERFYWPRMREDTDADDINISTFGANQLGFSTDHGRLLWWLSVCLGHHGSLHEVYTSICNHQQVWQNSCEQSG